MKNSTLIGVLLLAFFFTSLATHVQAQHDSLAVKQSAENFLLAKLKKEWKIVHIHASTLLPEK